MANKNLFSEFESTSTETWEKKIFQDLKGADYAKKLITKTIEGIDIKPYYRKEDIAELSHLMMNPGEFPFVRTNNIEDNFYEIRQDIPVNSFPEAAEAAKNAVARGASSVAFDLKDHDDITYEDFSVLAGGIDITEVEINFLCGNLSEKVISYLNRYISEKKTDSTLIRGSVDYDPLGNKTITGRSYGHKEGHCTFAENFTSLIENTKDKLPNFKVLTVHAHYFRDAGSSAVQEVAFAMAMGSDYLEKAVNAGIETDTAAPKFKFSFGVSSDYFIEIAKIRASRLLWAKITEAYGAKERSGSDMYIHSVTCDWNKTVYDPYVNVLRTTTEAMSAVLGGTDSLSIRPFNSSFASPDDFSERIARNIQIILKEEAYFDKAVDPAGGSYFVESLTNSIAEHAWELFKKIENEGGYHKALDKGLIKEMTEEIARQRDMNIAQRKEILLGTNQYPNRGEHVLTERKEISDLPENAVRMYRGAEAFEALRQRTEHAKKRPVVFLLTMGNLALRKARATFSGNFFACAGFEIIESEGFNNVDSAVDASLKANADITVVCSSDDEYPDIVPSIYEKLKEESIVVVAGYPKNSIDALKDFGIKHFIHVKSNVLDSLNNFQKELGIN